MNLLRARRALPYLAVLVVLCAAALLLGNATLTLNLEFARPSLKLPYSEMVLVPAAGAGAILLQPRMWEWERVAGGRARWLAAGWGLVACLAPCLVVLVGSLRVPAGVPVAWMVTNGLVLSAVTLLLAPLISGPVSAAVVLLAYVGHAIVNNLWWDTPFLPITRYPDGTTHWVAAAVLVTAAVACHYATCGATAWSRRTFSRDE